MGRERKGFFSLFFFLLARISGCEVTPGRLFVSKLHVHLAQDVWASVKMGGAEKLKTILRSVPTSVSRLNRRRRDKQIADVSTYVSSAVQYTVHGIQGRRGEMLSAVAQ